METGEYNNIQLYKLSNSLKFKFNSSFINYYGTKYNMVMHGDSITFRTIL